MIQLQEIYISDLHKIKINGLVRINIRSEHLYRALEDAAVIQAIAGVAHYSSLLENKQLTHTRAVNR